MAAAFFEKRMQVPIGVLWNVITDFESYPHFLPEVQGTKIIEKKDSHWTVGFEIEVMKQFKYTLLFEGTEPTSLVWKLKGGELFKKNSGRWNLRPVSERETHAQYELEVEFGFFVPSWVAKKLTESQLPSMVERFENFARGKNHG